MGVHIAKTYHRRMDDPNIGIQKVVELYADDAVLI